jgi:hypothetical protein
MKNARSNQKTCFENATNARTWWWCRPARSPWARPMWTTASWGWRRGRAGLRSPTPSFIALRAGASPITATSTALPPRQPHPVVSITTPSTSTAAPRTAAQSPSRAPPLSSTDAMGCDPIVAGRPRQFITCTCPMNRSSYESPAVRNDLSQKSLASPAPDIDAGHSTSAERSVDAQFRGGPHRRHSQSLPPSPP